MIGVLQCLIKNCAAIDYMYGTMEGVGANIKKLIQKWMGWDITITVVHTMKNIGDYIELNQETIEKWMLFQSVEELLELYVSMSMGTVPKVVQNYIKAIYLTHGEENQEARHFFNTWGTYVWKCLTSCVYSCYPSCSVFWSSRRKKSIYTFLFCWIHVITKWKLLNHFRNPVERINNLQVNWSLITLDICTSLFWI